jgi:hypothetical protein
LLSGFVPKALPTSYKLLKIGLFLQVDAQFSQSFCQALGQFVGLLGPFSFLLGPFVGLLGL